MNQPREVLTAPGYERLWAKARARLERNGLRLDGAFSISHPTDEERAAIVALLGGRRRVRGTQRVSVALEGLDAALRDSALSSGLVEWLETIGPPLVDRPAEKEGDRERRDALWSIAATHHLATEPWFAVWVEDLRRDGLLPKIAHGSQEELLVEGLTVLERLPADNISLPTFSASVFGDPKALDGSPTATIVERALAAWAGIERPHRAHERRELWARFGVILDDLASQVLVLNLAGTGDGMVSSLLGEGARAGEPIRLTLRQLLGSAVPVTPGLIHVCENPSVVVEAANNLGAACRPLVCTEGQPSSAFHRLITRLTEQGSDIAYHGDFDWPGIRIASEVLGRYQGAPWRMGAGDYVESVNRFGGIPLSGVQAPTAWDPSLSVAMSDRATVIYEEQVIDDLLADLARPAPGPGGHTLRSQQHPPGR